MIFHVKIVKMKAYLVAKVLSILQSQRFWDTGPHRSFLYYVKKLIDN